jgi:hypothetical protein
MSAAIGAFGRVAPYDLFEAVTLDERAKGKLAENLSSGAKVCCCTLAWCGGVKDVVLVPLNAAGIGGLKTKGVIKTTTNKAWKVKAAHYSAGNQLYLGLHHFDKDFAVLGADKRSVVLMPGADPSFATEQTAWNTAEILAELTRVNTAEALLNARDLAAGARDNEHRARALADQLEEANRRLSLALTSPWDVRNFWENGSINSKLWEERQMQSYTNFTGEQFVALYRIVNYNGDFVM